MLWFTKLFHIYQYYFISSSPSSGADGVLFPSNFTLSTKICLVKAVVFPVVMYGCESWTIKQAECWRIDAFELWCWRKLLRVPWTARRSNESILKEISPEYSLEGLMLKLKLQYFGHLMQRTDSLKKTLMLGKTDGRRRRGWQRMRWLDGITELNGHEFEQAPGVGDGQGSLACCSPWGHIESDTTERLNWTAEKMLPEITWFTWGHIASQCWSWDLTPSPLRAGLMTCLPLNPAGAVQMEIWR